MSQSISTSRELLRRDAHAKASRLLAAHLSKATADLKAARNREARRVAFTSASRCFVFTALATAIAVVICRRTGRMASIAVLVGGSCFVLSLLLLSTAWWVRTRRTNVATREAAERLDLAAQDHNAIATALDLSQSGVTSSWVAKAIADGVTAAETHSMLSPPLPASTIVRPRSALALVVGIATVWLASRTPKPTHTFEIARDGELAAATPGTLDEGTTKLPSSATAPEALRHSIGPAPTRGPAVPRGTGQSAGQADAPPAAASDARPQESAASAGKAKGQGLSDRPPAQPSDAGERPAVSPAEATSGQKSVQATSFGSASADAMSSEATPSGSAAGSSPGAKRRNDRSRSSDGSGGATPSVKSEPSEPAGSRDATGESGKSDGGSGRGVGLSSGQSTSGSGRSNGQSPPKKSRGVAPLMLGARQPDLLQGRALPGPDERTELQVPPQPASEDASPSEVAPERRTPEPPVPGYRVPANARRMVADYFQHFHQDDDARAATPDVKIP